MNTNQNCSTSSPILNNRIDYTPTIDKRPININLPNKNLLCSIVRDNLRNNRKLDTEEIDRASEKLKYMDDTNIKKVKI